MFGKLVTSIESIARSLETIVREIQEMRYDQKILMSQAIDQANRMSPEKIMEISEALTRKLIPTPGVKKDGN